MKSPLLIGVSALILLASATLLFAQTTTGSSLITEMKAAIRPFTLAGDLNPGVTGLESSPLVGKRTGDMLSAGEYNRILELVGQGGGGGGKFEITDATTKTSYYLAWTGSAWDTLGTGTAVVESCPGFTHCAKLDTAAHDFCMIRHTGGSSPHVAFTYIGAKKYSLQTSTSGSSSIAVICYDNIGTGGGGTTPAPAGIGLDCKTISTPGTLTGASAVTAYCPSDRKAISGGCSHFVPAANSVPAVESNGWYCSNTSVQQGGTAYVVCCK